MTNEQEKYLKAKNDLLKAFNDLTEQQKKNFVKEVVGTEQFMFIYNKMNNSNNGDIK